MAELDFYFPHSEEDWDQRVHVFVVKSWEGEPVESEEMGCEWHDLDKLPFDKMWDDDKFWLPKVLEGRNIKGAFHFGEDNSTLTNHAIIDMVYGWEKF